jgi:hypothetical protein
MSRRARIILGIALLSILGCCVLLNMHVCSTFKARTGEARIVAGQSAVFTFWQFSPFGGVLGHVCWEGMPLYVQGLPPDSGVSGVDWSECHIGTMTITTQPTTPPGIYRLKVSKDDGLAICPSRRVILEVRAP